ncbi:MAG TPA: hypothetical protein PKJ16_14545 [Spirochaetota bacterium]|mgnify:CR=1 FL=1|nr:hypothetical protein [Spirochaetota bacterium]HOS38284.1 hypothetical protein [Spirochaetota bacterium]HPU88202.1 hypothetical protein [Spirochaetota bacterium]
MMELNIGRMLMELLAAAIIQFTPVDSYFETNRTWTWGDTLSRWYVLEPSRQGEYAVFTFRRFEGEVRVADSIVLTARRGRDGKYAWMTFRRDYDKSARAFVAPLPDNAGNIGAVTRFTPAVWESSAANIPLKQKGAPTVDGVPCTQLLFSDGLISVNLVLGRPGLREMTIVAPPGGPGGGENRLRLENP